MNVKLGEEKNEGTLSPDSLKGKCLNESRMDNTKTNNECIIFSNCYCCLDDLKFDCIQFITDLSINLFSICFPGNKLYSTAASAADYFRPFR